MSGRDEGSRSRILYLPHGGGPLPLLGDPAHAGLTRFLREIPASLGEPKAILVVSAHWEEARPTLTGGAQPPLVYDYSGFPPESYRIRYPAPGSPALAEQVRSLLAAAGVEAAIDAARGFDHGLFVPLKLMYPDAALPCVQLSLTRDLDPARHLALGRALAPLRDEGVLVVGSGLSFHNLRVFFAPRAGARVDESAEFDAWLRATLTAPELDAGERERRLCAWESAPYARYCHPREEHLLPVHVCLGAAAGAPARVAYSGTLYGKRVSALLW